MDYRSLNRIKGAGTALVTPFCEDGSVDAAALRQLVEENVAGGMDFLCVLGTTAETPTLSAAEQAVVKKTVVETVGGRVPLLLGFGGNNTAGMIEAMGSSDFEGFDALLIVAPYYNKPNQEGLYQHYRALSEASPLPLILYNVPGRTGVNILPDTVLRIAADCPRVVGVKEASGNLDQIKAVIAGRPSGFVVLSGDDPLTCDIMDAGGDGVISVMSNARPSAVAGIIHDPASAREVDAVLRGYYPLLFKEGNPVGVKGLLSLEGKMCNKLRLPLVPASEGLMEELGAVLETEDLSQKQ